MHTNKITNRKTKAKKDPSKGRTDSKKRERSIDRMLLLFV
jgi:hypothetical protein